MPDWRKRIQYDCIHRAACKRMQAISIKKGTKVPIYCTDECVLYEQKDTECISKDKLNDALDALDQQLIQMNPLCVEDEDGTAYGRGYRHGGCVVIDAITKWLNEQE